MSEWIRSHDTLLWSLAGVSVVTFFGSLFAVPFLIVRIPADYFAHSTRHRTISHSRHPVINGVGIVIKNLLGCLFIALGVILLVLPGQGALTILVGIMLLDFPGKYRLERWIVSRRPVNRAVNWLRGRANRPPLVLEEDTGGQP